MCRHCARLARQVKMMGEAASKWTSFIGHDETDSAGEDLESRLLRKLSGKDR